MAAEYLKRASRWTRCEMREIDPRRFDPFERRGLKVLLDPAGRAVDSAAFADLLRKGEDILFIVGGADGLPLSWRPRADLLLSLSPLTLPHELARALLAEQIYRALATLRGHPYPR